MPIGAEPKPESRVMGLATRRLGNETRWSLLSRGDRVHGRTLTPAGAGRHPVILLVGPDGVATSAFVDSAAAAWCARAALVVFDLPLCGSRKSDKLTALALDARLPLAERLRSELEAQVGSDLAEVQRLIAADPALDATRVTFVGVGLGAELARTFLAETRAFAHVALAPDGTPTAGWLREIGERASRENPGPARLTS